MTDTLHILELIDGYGFNFEEVAFSKNVYQEAHFAKFSGPKIRNIITQIIMKRITA